MLTQQDLLEPIEYVSSCSSRVSIDEKALQRYVDGFSLIQADHWIKSYPLKPLPTLSLSDQMALFFLMGSQAFCFWGEPKWTIEYKKQKLDGWWALVASFHRAIEEGVPITDGRYLSAMSEDQAKSLFRGTSEIPLFSERLHILNSIGKKLVKDYGGDFFRAMQSCRGNALSLLELVASFEGFDDVVVYQGKRIPFYKKAQVVVSDIDELLKTSGEKGLEGIEQLPGHADYKIPAQLRNLGILRYTRDLSDLVDNKLEIQSDSEMEVEIRANQLWAIHQIVELLKPKYPAFNASTQNGILWVQSQTKRVGEKPYHRTRTIYY